MDDKVDKAESCETIENSHFVFIDRGAELMSRLVQTDSREKSLAPIKSKERTTAENLTNSLLEDYNTSTAINVDDESALVIIERIMEYITLQCRCSQDRDAWTHCCVEHIEHLSPMVSDRARCKGAIITADSLLIRAGLSAVMGDVLLRGLFLEQV